MHRYIIKRLLFLIPTVLGVTLIIYIVMNITPGNPGRMILGPNATAAEVEAMNDELGYNDPVLVRWFNYLKNIITEGDFASLIPQSSMFWMSSGPVSSSPCVWPFWSLFYQSVSAFRWASCRQ